MDYLMILTIMVFIANTIATYMNIRATSSAHKAKDEWKEAEKQLRVERLRIREREAGVQKGARINLEISRELLKLSDKHDFDAEMFEELMKIGIYPHMIIDVDRREVNKESEK